MKNFKKIYIMLAFFLIGIFLKYNWFNLLPYVDLTETAITVKCGENHYLKFVKTLKRDLIGLVVSFYENQRSLYICDNENKCLLISNSSEFKNAFKQNKLNLLIDDNENKSCVSTTTRFPLSSLKPNKFHCWDIVINLDEISINQFNEIEKLIVANKNEINDSIEKNIYIKNINDLSINSLNFKIKSISYIN